MITKKDNTLYFLYLFMGLLFRSVNASEIAKPLLRSSVWRTDSNRTEQNEVNYDSFSTTSIKNAQKAQKSEATQTPQKSYDAMKEWAQDKHLLTNNDANILKLYESTYLKKMPLECTKILIHLIKNNSLAKNNGQTNFTSNNSYETYFFQKYIQSLLNAIPTDLTTSDLSSLEQYYAQLKNINEIHFKFVTQHILPNAIESLSNIQHNGYINSLEDCSQALLFFGISEDLINEYFVYTELYDKSHEKSLEEQIPCIIEKISKKIIYKAKNQEAISETSVAKNIQDNILGPLEKIIAALNNKGTDKAIDSNPIAKPLKETNEAQPDLPSKAVTSDKERPGQNESNYNNILNINNLLKLITDLISIQNQYKKIVADKEKLIKNIPQLCNDITSWIKETTLTQTIPQSCNNENISALLYNIRAELITKYNEAKEMKGASIDTNQPKKTAGNAQQVSEQHAIKLSKQDYLNIKYNEMNTTLTNLSIKEPNQSIKIESSLESETTQDEHVYEYDSAFNFFKNAYNTYEKLVIPTYCQWAAKEKKIHINDTTSLLKIVNIIKSEIINIDINQIKVYDEKEGDHLTAILKNASTLETLEFFLHNSSPKSVEKVKKIYILWASANALVVDSKEELKSKTLENISQAIQNALKEHITKINNTTRQKILINKIKDKKNIKELSKFYIEIRNAINSEQQKAKTEPEQPLNSDSVPKVGPEEPSSSHIVAKQSWWSWFSSWISVKKNK